MTVFDGRKFITKILFSIVSGNVKLPEHIGGRNDFTDEICGKHCSRNPGKLYAKSSHQGTNYEMALNTSNLCHISGEMCKSVGELKRHANIQKNKPNDS